MKKLVQRKVIFRVYAPDGNMIDGLECLHQRRAIPDGVGGFLRMETRGCRKCVRIKGDGQTYMTWSMNIGSAPRPMSGTRVKTKGVLGSTDGIFVTASFLANRRRSTLGRFTNFVPGHGGDVWLIAHDDGSVAPYSYRELHVYVPVRTHKPSEPRAVFKAEEMNQLVEVKPTPGLIRGELNVVMAPPR